MSIDTLLEAARYLEWQAQQQQQGRREDELCKERDLISREAESRRVDPVTSSPPAKANHWADDAVSQQPPHPPAPPPPSLPPAQVPIAVIPMVPVVTPSVPPLPLTTPVAAAATSLNSPPPVKKEHASPPPQLLLQPAAPQHLLCTSQIKVEPSQQLIDVKPQLQYPASINTNGSHHALVPRQAPPTPQPRPNGVTIEDLRGMEGKRRPGGAGTREVHNKLEKNRRAHLKECFETLKKNVPNVDEKKTSNLSVLRSALRYIQTLKRKEKEYEHEMERLAREKIATQQRLAELKNELSQVMDVVEMERVLRQTVQPEDDQASTSTASEGEDNYEQEDPDVPAPPAPAPPILQAQALLTPHLSIQHAALPLSGVLATSGPPQAIAPAPPPPHPVPAVQVQPTVIAHAAVSHPSVIQAVNHALPAKHLTHIAPSPGPSPSAPQPIGHITVHPVAHLGAPHLPALYPQGVSQPTVVGHITHTFTHVQQAPPPANTNGAQVSQGSPSLGKPTAVLAPHPQLVGQAAVLNPVTMVTVPTFPVSTLKLA
ncbi:MAX network transcriptional repressor b [Leuresthes tenuis]|uniref:MAX network transcriptional repressor b n=1 Tax=Leuresthes tenuis TaxID=355514 RepID=UPI003B50431B